MDHLRDAPEAPDVAEQLRREAEGGAEGEKQEEVDDPRKQEVYSFQFDFADARGKRWRGTFTNRILTIKDQRLVGVYIARLAQGASWAVLDPLTREILTMLAHLEFSLDKKRPAWAKNLEAMHDIAVLQALYREVALHEATFLGTGEGAASS